MHGRRSHGAGVQMCAHVSACSGLIARTHEPSRAGAGVLGAGGWCARSGQCKGLGVQGVGWHAAGLWLWAHAGPTGVTGGLRHRSSHRGGCCPTHPALRGLCWQHWGAPGPTCPHPPALCLWHRSAGLVRVTLCCTVRLKANICPGPAAEAQCGVCCARRPWAAPQGVGEGHHPIWVTHNGARSPLRLLHAQTSPSRARTPSANTPSVHTCPGHAHTHTHTCTAAHTHTHTHRMMTALLPSQPTPHQSSDAALLHTGRSGTSAAARRGPGLGQAGSGEGTARRR